MGVEGEGAEEEKRPMVGVLVVEEWEGRLEGESYRVRGRGGGWVAGRCVDLAESTVEAHGKFRLARSVH